MTAEEVAEEGSPDVDDPPGIGTGEVLGFYLIKAW